MRLPRLNIIWPLWSWMKPLTTGVAWWMGDKRCWCTMTSSYKVSGAGDTRGGRRWCQWSCRLLWAAWMGINYSAADLWIITFPPVMVWRTLRCTRLLSKRIWERNHSNSERTSQIVIKDESASIFLTLCSFKKKTFTADAALRRPSWESMGGGGGCSCGDDVNTDGQRDRKSSANSSICKCAPMGACVDHSREAVLADVLL